MTEATSLPHEVVRLRLSPTLRRDVQTYQQQAGVTNTSEALRNLIAEGLGGQAAPSRRVKPRLSRPQYAERAAGLVDALGDVLEALERHDPQGAQLLSQGLVKAVTQYHDDLMLRTGA